MGFSAKLDTGYWQCSRWDCGSGGSGSVGRQIKQMRQRLCDASPEVLNVQYIASIQVVSVWGYP